ncbi:MAG: acylglycerol kinase family protein [Lewinellaceae bacterium]|nr:acylglycerol kinase family protein [Lewinellaceae bacterium]
MARVCTSAQTTECETDGTSTSRYKKCVSGGHSAPQTHWLYRQPKAGRNLRRHIRQSVEQHLDHKKFIYGVWHTERASHAAELAGRPQAEGYDIVVAVGGDGSINRKVASVLPCHYDPRHHRGRLRQRRAILPRLPQRPPDLNKGCPQTQYCGCKIHRLRPAQRPPFPSTSPVSLRQFCGQANARAASGEDFAFIYSNPSGPV